VWSGFSFLPMVFTIGVCTHGMMGGKGEWARMSNRIAFVTSGAKGLGHAITQTLMEAGWDVFFTYMSSSQEAERLKQFGLALGRRAVPYHADLLDKDGVLAAVEACKSTLGHADALIHNFGPFVFERFPLTDYTDEMWSRMMDGNLNSFFWIYRALVPDMRLHRFGRIVSIGYDGAGEAAGWRYRAAYGAAKTALASLTRSIAREERENGITANMVCPGDIRGKYKMEMIRDLANAQDVVEREPVGEDVARVIEFFCKEQSQQLNGTILEVTGGNDIRFKDTWNRSCEDGARR
jgi:3-oxoacyl-[acyl-carrier protein] reductase